MTDTRNPKASNLGFDPDALHARYLAERDKRLRPDGLGQYVQLQGRFAEYGDDPYARRSFSAAAERLRGRRCHRRRLLGSDHRSEPSPGRRAGHPNHRAGCRLRGYVVLEPLPGYPLRCRVVHLHAVPRGAGVHPEREVLRRRRRYAPTARRSAGTSISTPTHAFRRR